MKEAYNYWYWRGVRDARVDFIIGLIVGGIGGYLMAKFVL